MSSITGTIVATFLRMEPMVPMSGYIIDPFHREGVAGRAWQLTGLHGEPMPLTTLGGFTGGTLAAARAAHKTLQGQVVVIVDDFGITWTNLVVVRASPTVAFPITGGVGDLGGKTVMLRTEWLIDTAAIGYA